MIFYGSIVPRIRFDKIKKRCYYKCSLSECIVGRNETYKVTGMCTAIAHTVFLFKIKEQEQTAISFHTLDYVCC